MLILKITGEAKQVFKIIEAMARRNPNKKISELKEVK